MPADFLNVAEIQGLNEFRRELRKLHGNWGKELRKVHKTIATEGAKRSQQVARGMGGEPQHFASSIRGAATQASARITVVPVANAAFWGAKAHSGWYAARRYFDSTEQHQPWVGASWDVAVAGQGPYAINDALARYKPALIDEYAEMIDDLCKRAFPGGLN